MFVLPEMKPEQILIYLRKSRTDDPALSVSETVAKHEQMLDEWCLRNLGALIPEQNRFREVVSGETIEARPEIKKVLRLIEQDRFKAILIVEPQRLSRGDLEDIGKISKLLRYTKTFVITLQYSYDLTDERDRDYFERELKRGNEYLEYQKRIMGNGRFASVERGNYLGTTAPYGYERIWIKEGKRKSPSLRINPDEAEIVKKIYSMYADFKGASAICKELNSIGIPARHAAQWKSSSIYQILDNPVYIGMVRWHSTRETKQIIDGELEKQRKRQSEYPIFPGKHEPIISESLWNSVRERRKARDISRVHVSKEMINPFAGLVRCSCGAAVVLWASNPKVSSRLRCLERHVCKSSSCRYQDFLQIVSESLKASIEDIEVVASGDTTPDNSEEIKRLKNRIEQLSEKEKTLWEKYAEGMPKAIFEDLLKKNESERNQAESLLSAEMEKYSNREQLQSQIVTLHTVIDLIQKIDGVPVKQANRLLKSCIKQITYSRKTAQKQSGGNRGGWNSEPIELEIELNF